MPTATIKQHPNQLIVNVEDPSMLVGLKKAIGMMRGVTGISIPRKRPSAYELSLRDIETGRLNSYESVDDFFNFRVNSNRMR